MLLVSHRPLDYGGAGARRWGYMIGALRDLGWEVETVSPPPNPTADEMSSDPRVARLSALRSRVMGRIGKTIRPAYRRLLHVQPEAFPPNVLWSFTGRGDIRAAVERFRPDVVVATAPPPAALFASAAVVRGTGIPLVADMRDPWAGSPFYDAGGTLLTDIERRAFRACAAIVAVTDPMLADLRERHPDLADRMQVLPNGFDPSILELRGQVPVPRPDGRVTLIHPGSLYGERSIDVLVQALSRPGLRDRVRLELVGNMSAASEAAVRGADPQLEIDVSSPLPWRETIERIAAADAVVVIQPPQVGDDVAWPGKMFEALALGKAVLTLTGGGACEGLLRELGLDRGFARWNDVDSVADATALLLESAPVAVPVERLARWDRSIVARDYDALLDRVADGGPAAANPASQPAVVR
jgi:glycosyltransferase involved in cell wall biosynthesis